MIAQHSESVRVNASFNLRIKGDVGPESKKISIDTEKENEIINQLEKLEQKLIYLNYDFTQEYVANKIRTNTTYLSHVVNKRFGKSFSEYTTDLKINYAINQLITNPEYRKFTTQRMAETIGFKNATSFTKSFIKKTGLPLSEFLKNMN